ERKCVAGKSYNDGCNHCMCQESGLVACTLMACAKYDPETDTFKQIERLDPPEDFWEKSE
ncbi:hypothetical protein WN55_03757, partial [Dufourea novaeangliae]